MEYSVIEVKERKMLSAAEVADVLGVSVALGYKIIAKLNHEMEKKGYLTIHGRVDEHYFVQRYFTPKSDAC